MDAAPQPGLASDKPSPAHAATNAAPAKKEVPSESGVPPNLVYAGILVGILLILIGVGLLIGGKSSLLSSLMTCVGFGIVLASFGSKAGGSWAGWSATGAGALAILLFLLLQHFTPEPSLVPAKRGQIRGDFSRIADIRIIDESPMYEFRDPTTASERFIILDKALKSQRMSVQVDTTEKGPNHEFFELIGSSQAISERYLSDTADPNKVIQWTIDYDHRLIKDGGTIIFAEADQLDENMFPKKQQHTMWWSTLMRSAVAESAPPSGATVARLLPDLESDDPAARRNARDALTLIGAPSVAPMMTELRAHPEDYRLRDGVIYVLATTLTRNPAEKSAISSALRSEDFPILVSAASDDDKTVRLQAAVFLYLLGDPRAIPYSVDAARDAHDNNKAANQISILDQSAQGLPPDKKADIIRNAQRDLTQGPGPNNDLVGKNGWLHQKTVIDSPLIAHRPVDWCYGNVDLRQNDCSPNGSREAAKRACIGQDNGYTDTTGYETAPYNGLAWHWNNDNRGWVELPSGRIFSRITCR